MPSFPTHTSVLSLHGALGSDSGWMLCPCRDGDSTGGMDPAAAKGGDVGLDWGEKLLPSLVPPSVTLVSLWALPPQPGTALGLCIPAPEDETQPLQHFYPTIPKNCTELPPSLVRAG